MSLKDYLTAYFPNGSIGSFEGQEVEIVSHFKERFGVNVKQENDLYLFKYDQLLVKFGIPLTKECRGHVYSNKNGQWECRCRAMDKFWNFDESWNPIFSEQDFQTYINQIQLRTKEDGSLIHLFWNDNDWKLTTSGSLTLNNINDYDLTFGDLFWKTLNQDDAVFKSKLNKEYTYIFELCSRFNAIVSLYKNDRIYFLNARNNLWGTYLPVEDIAKELNLPLPKSLFLYELNVKTKDELVMWVENNCKDDEDCKNKEGFVGYINSVPAFKLKSNRYKFLHSFKGNNEKETRNNIISAYFNNSIDDVYNDLHETSKLFVESLRLKVVSMVNDVDLAVEKMKGMKFDTQKDYALFVLANAPKQCSSFFFANKEKILNNDNVSELFTHWLHTSYKRYEDYWKS